MKSSMTGHTKMTFKCRLLFNRGDHVGKFEFILSRLFLFCFTIAFVMLSYLYSNSSCNRKYFLTIVNCVCLLKIYNNEMSNC